MKNECPNLEAHLSTLKNCTSLLLPSYYFGGIGTGKLTSLLQGFYAIDLRN